MNVGQLAVANYVTIDYAFVEAVITTRAELTKRSNYSVKSKDQKEEEYSY